MKRNLFNLLFIVLTLGIIIVLAFSNSELTNAWGALFTLDLRWVLCALLGWAVYTVFDMLNLYYFLYKQKQPISIRSALYVTFIGFYYSNITPSASGGQPLQIYYLSKRNVPVPIGTSAISIKFFATQMMLVLLSTTFWLIDKNFVNTQLAGVKWAIYIGYAINFCSIPLILLAALHRPLVQTVIGFFVRLGGKMKLLKHPDEMMVRINAGLDVYHASILRLASHPKQLIGMLALAGVSILGLMSIPLSVYHAFRMTGTPWHTIIAVAFLLFLSASYTPLPGASGAQEGGFLVFFGSMFTKGTVGLALLVWRFFSYYLFLIVGGLISIIGQFHAKHTPRNTQKAQEAPVENPVTEPLENP
jgi:glycosyltransferase 2 family protein